MAVRLELGDPRSQSTSGAVSVWTDGPDLLEGRPEPPSALTVTTVKQSSEVDINVINRLKLEQRAYPQATMSDHQMKFSVLQKISLATICQSNALSAILGRLGSLHHRHVLLEPNAAMIIAPYFRPAAAGARVAGICDSCFPAPVCTPSAPAALVSF